MSDVPHRRPSRLSIPTRNTAEHGVRDGFEETWPAFREWFVYTAHDVRQTMDD